MAEENTPKRIKIEPKKKMILESSIITNTDILINDARCIISAELAHYRAKSGRGITLDLKEARVIQGYLETLLKLQREERESARAEDLSNLSDEELLALAAKVLNVTNPKLAPPTEET